MGPQPRCYWWEIAEILKKLFLVGFFVLIEPGQTIQLVIGFGAAWCISSSPTFSTPSSTTTTTSLRRCATSPSSPLFLCVAQAGELAEAVGDYLSEDMFGTYYFDAGAGLAASS